MAVIQLEYIKTGMVLKQDVKNTNGVVLLGAGGVISEKTIRFFKMWGIAEIDIVDDNKKDKIIVSEPFLKKAEKKCKILFQHTNTSHPVMKRIYKYCAVRFAEKMAQEKQ